MSSKKNPYTATQQNHSPPQKVKEWAMKKLKEGSSPNKIAQDIQKLFGVYVAMMTVYRWRKKYIAATGENIPGWHELNETLEQKAKNKSKKREKRSLQK
jgi:IS30 family transposase